MFNYCVEQNLSGFEKNAGAGTHSCFTLRVSALLLDCLCLAASVIQMSEVFEILHTFKC